MGAPGLSYYKPIDLSATPLRESVVQRLKLGLLCFLLAVPIWSAAQIFECTDASGVKEFAPKCGPGTVKQRQISQGGTSPLNSETSAPAAKTYKEQEAEFQQRRLEKQEAEAKATAKAGECIKKRVHLRNLETAPRAGTVNPTSRERKILSDDERKAEIEKTRDWIAQSCK